MYRKKQRRLIVETFVLGAFVEICDQSFCNFVRKVEYRLRTAFSRYFETVDVEIEIVDVKTDQFAYTDACAEKQRHYRKIAQTRLFVKSRLPSVKSFAAVHAVQQPCHFIHFEPYDGFFVQFRRKNFRCGIGIYRVFIVKVFEERLNGGQFAGFCLYGIGIDIVIVFVIVEKFQKRLYLRRSDFIELFESEIRRVVALEFARFGEKIIEKDP